MLDWEMLALPISTQFVLLKYQIIFVEESSNCRPESRGLISNSAEGCGCTVPIPIWKNENIEVQKNSMGIEYLYPITLIQLLNVSDFE